VIKILIPLVSLFLLTGLYAQDSLYLKIFGDPDGYGSEEIECVIQTSDFGIVSAGFSDGFSVDGNGDAIIIKTDKNGHIQWAKTYGDTTDNMAVDIKETPDGGLIFCGWTMTGGNYDFWIVKLNSAGSIQWEKRFGGSGDEQAWSVDIASDGYLVVGGTNSFGAGLTDVWVLKLDFNGNVIWQKAYGTSGDDAPPGSYQEYVARGFVDKNGDFVISSVTDGAGHGGTDVYVIKLTPSDGSIKWQYAYGDTEDDALWNFIESKDGNSYYLPGNMISPNTLEGDLWVVKIDTAGNIIWQKTFGISGKWDEALNASATADGILLASYFETGTLDWGASAIKVNNSGNLQWAKIYKIGNLDWTNDLKELSDNSIIIAGVTTDTTTWNGDYLYIRANSNGDVPGCNYVTGFTPNITTTNTYRQVINFTPTVTNASPLAIISAQSDVSPLLLTFCESVIRIEEKESGSKREKRVIHSNFVRNFIYVSNLNLRNKILKIYDVSLREIKTLNFKTDVDRINVGYLEPGVYYIKIMDKRGREILNQKIIKIK